MIELLRIGRVIGLRRLLRLYRAYRLGWEGIISGFYTTRAMQALFNVGFFHEMQEKGVVSVEAFAESRQLDATILRSLCHSLYALSILQKDGSGYSLDSKGRILVEVAYGWFDGVYGYEEVFHSLESLLRGETVYGKDVIRRPGFIARGSGEMERQLYFPLAIREIEKNGYRRVLDLGCGDAIFLTDLCASNDEMVGFGIDISPQAISEGRDRVKRTGLEGRIQLIVQNISELDAAPDHLQDIDVATVFFVLHEVLFAGSDRVIELLQSFRRLFPGVPLIVFEAIRPTPEEMRKRPGMAVQYTLQHDLTHQSLVDRKEWQGLFKMAGFDSIEERYLRFARTAVYTLR